jgi:release factor glutamine methyltransferase
VKVFKESSSGYPELDSCEFIGTDISKKALSVAKKNAKLSGVDDKIKFLQGDLLEPILKNKKLNIKNKNVIITANLPYLTAKQVKESPSIQKEPKLALIAGNDDLKYYQKLFKQIKKLNMLCASCYVLCEIDPRQTLKIKKLIKKELPQAKFEIKKDLARLDRLVVIKLG